MVIYQGEWGEERYRILRDLCLTHRDILPFAQEELYKRLDIRLDKRMNMLNRSIGSSERCKEYAGRTESIYVEYCVDVDKLIESGAFNPRELWGEDTMNFSTLSGSNLNHVTSSPLTLILSTDRFQNLRRVHLFEAQCDQALALPNLETYWISDEIPISIRTTIALTSINLPSLRRLFLHHVMEGRFGQLYDSIVPQLDHLTISWLDETELERLLLLSTSLQSLRCRYNSSVVGCSKVIDQISRINVKELQCHWALDHQDSDTWETDFESIEMFKGLVAGKDELKRLELKFSIKFSRRRSLDRCDQALARWKGIKDELKSICLEKGIEAVALTCNFVYGDTIIWQE
jgi:hypothetical protein